MHYYIIFGLFVFSIILSIVAQVKVNNSYAKYSKVMASSGVTAKELARRVLDVAGLQEIEVVGVRGTMTDYYNHKKGIIALSDGVRDSQSIAGLGIMAHEVGHALQYQAGYFPIKLRNLAVTVSSFYSKLMWPLLLIGLIVDLFLMADVGIGIMYAVLILYLVTTLVGFITLPVEFDASKRALKLLDSTGTLNGEELRGAKEVLTAAGLTYVASFVLSLVQLLRIITIISDRR